VHNHDTTSGLDTDELGLFTTVLGVRVRVELGVDVFLLERSLACVRGWDSVCVREWDGVCVRVGVSDAMGSGEASRRVG
jgi:hypothetical protein